MPSDGFGKTNGLSSAFFFALLMGAIMFIMAILNSGCATMDKYKPYTCIAAEVAYTAYVSVINKGGHPSQDQINGARIAAAFLEAYCGWSAPTTTPGVESGKAVPVPVLDHNGVLVVIRPQ